MKLLICSDGSAQAQRAVRLGATIAAACSSEVTLFGIVEREEHSKDLLESLKRAESVLRERQVNVEVIARSGDPTTEIQCRTEEHKYDLVIIGAVRKQTRGLYWMSSKSYDIIKRLTPPVLSVAGRSQELRRILVCTGGRRYIENAFHVTAEIAAGLKIPVTLLHVLPALPVIYSGLPRLEQTTAELLASESELGINLRHAKQVLEASGVETEIRLRHGAVLNEILREIEESQSDMVVTGAPLSRNLRSYMMGDITREIVNRSACAVLVARTQTVVEYHPALFLKSLLSRLRGA